MGFDKMNIKDIFWKVFENCPQDEDALIRLIMRICMNEKIYNLDDKTLKEIYMKHSNILVDGNFGVGKTTMISEIARTLDIPFAKFLFPTLGKTTVSSDILAGNFKDIFTDMYKQSRNPKLHGIVLIDELENSIELDCFNILDYIIGIKTFTIYDSEEDKYIDLDISNITFIGEVNNNKAYEYIDIPRVEIANPSDKIEKDPRIKYLAFNDEEVRESIVKENKGASEFAVEACIQSIKTEIINQWRTEFIYNRIQNILNSTPLWHLFGEHISFKELNEDDIKIILKDSGISEYKNLAVMFDDDYLAFMNQKVIDKIASSVVDDPNGLNSIPDYFHEVRSGLMNNGYDLLSEHIQEKKYEKRI